MAKSKPVTEEFLDKKLDEKLEANNQEMKTFILESKEQIMGEIKNMREEFDTHQYSHIRINDELQKHDTRLKALEPA
jgi:predicted GNAT family acetyltransferase